MLSRVATRDLGRYMEEMDPEDLDQLPNEDSSDEDDKNAPNFWSKIHGFETLPSNVQEAIMKSKEKAKHSEFYYKLRNLQDRIGVYKTMFYNRKPVHLKMFLARQKEHREKKQNQ